MLTPATLATVPPGVDTVNMKARHPYHHGNLSPALVDAAMALARTGGPGAVALRAVSREAGVSHSAAYRHFADHDELLGAVAARCMDELAALMSARTDEVSARGAGPRARARLRAIGRAYIEFAVSEPGWFRTAFAGVDLPPGTPAEQDDEGPPGPFELLGTRLDELVEAGVLPAERRPGAEFAALSMVHGLSSLLVDGPLRGAPADEVDGLIDSVLDVVERGL